MLTYQRLIIGFNTQPPEGGWAHSIRYSGARSRFNTQPPEGGWCETSF